MRGIGSEGVVQSACKGGLLFVCLLLAACSSRYDESHGGSWRGYSETGYASYYADRYHGKKTASGELYRNNLNSAAHMELPFGSMVRVTNLANGKSVVVKVNDRGAFKSGRIIDLSKSAFGSIANIREGVIKVKVEVL
ncbi:septal ring lytic transglycosylase RlpA family protein [Aeromonas veronii]|uniref:septal ring lytic transglycosylase RlpA family protein n=1 Tax=Aeromonas veronii TaxID=654 RepID=UPI001ECF2925|nr:septal ring lytic transglycosylase RlpA family protein [Aeromonas veronii]MBM0416626.1 septal ring lytic transglycosylase RlpA family protein [Aeromonas veronii]MBW3788524.1 septal ring lytic transglycosylase RlpA family protein [Aeromonas veronii]UZE61703.1 septal ring lytic transglycosylase RlpA family protein [Aeromonas veronii]